MTFELADPAAEVTHVFYVENGTMMLMKSGTGTQNVRLVESGTNPKTYAILIS